MRNTYGKPRSYKSEGKRFRAHEAEAAVDEELDDGLTEEARRKADAMVKRGLKALGLKPAKGVEEREPPPTPLAGSSLANAYRATVYGIICDEE